MIKVKSNSNQTYYQIMLICSFQYNFPPITSNITKSENYKLICFDSFAFAAFYLTTNKCFLFFKILFFLRNNVNYCQKHRNNLYTWIYVSVTLFHIFNAQIVAIDQMVDSFGRALIYNYVVFKLSSGKSNFFKKGITYC